MRVKYTKMNGAGNDFIILNNFEEHLIPDVLPMLARRLCDRRLSIGADGLMVVDRADGAADFKMRFYNADGSEGEMCGNGARCICRYGYENGLSGCEPVIETTAGIVHGTRIDRRNYRVRLPNPEVMRLGLELEACGKTWRCAYVELGNPGLPHAVVEYKGLANADEHALFELGKTLRYHPEFPKGANVNFYEITGENAVLLRTWERGVEDFTYACGTGTGSAAAVLCTEGKVSEKNICVRMRGGLLTIDIDRNGEQIENLWLTGPTNLVAHGQVLDEELPM